MADRQEITTAIAEALESLRMITVDSTKARGAVKALADESRDNAELRRRLSDQHTFYALTIIVEDGLREGKLGWTASALRCIGNSCNEAGGGDRARDYLVQQGFHWAKRCLDEEDNFDIRSLTTRVLYNICCGHEGAQKQCFEEELYFGLIRFIHNLAYDSDIHADQPLDQIYDTFNVAVDVLFDICGHRPESKNRSTAIPPLLFDLCSFEEAKLDIMDLMDQIGSLYETLLIFLGNADVQNGLMQPSQFEKVWKTFLMLEGKMVAHARDHPSDADPEDVDMIQQHLVSVSLKYTWVLSDMSANRAFTSVYNPTCEFMIIRYNQLADDSENLRKADSIASAAAVTRVLTALCQILGNFLWGLPPESYGHLVIDLPRNPELSPWNGGLEELLFPSVDQIMAETDDEQLLHSGALLIVMLARSGIKARERMGSEPSMKMILTKLCRHEQSGLRQDAIKLLKVLGTDCPANQERFHDLATEVMNSLSQAQKTSQQMQMPHQMPSGNGACVS